MSESQKKSIWESLRHTFLRPPSWRHRLSQNHVTVLKFPQVGNETQDSHHWPFFSSHVTISMSLWLFASLPKFLLMTVDRLQQNWVFSQSLEIFIWQQQCCVMAVTKMDIKICKPENYMYSWSTLSILILKISIVKTQLFLHRLWGIMESGSVTIQHISRSCQLQGTLPRCARCSHQGHRYHRTAAPDFLQQLSRPFLLASKSSECFRMPLSPIYSVPTDLIWCLCACWKTQTVAKWCWD